MEASIEDDVLSWHVAEHAMTAADFYTPSSFTFKIVLGEDKVTLQITLLERQDYDKPLKTKCRYCE